MKKIILILLFAFIGGTAHECIAQRQQHLGRGVVANYATGKGVMISWRRLIQDPENATYNIYLNGKKLMLNQSQTQTTLPIHRGCQREQLSP